MIILGFIIPVILGFLLIYKSIRSLDKINRANIKGIKKTATVIKIREESISGSLDESFISDYSCYFTIKFTDNDGIVQNHELEFSANKKPKSKPPFKVNIYYYKNENKKPIIVIDDRNIKFNFYSYIFFGVLALSFAIYFFSKNFDSIINILR